MTPLNINDLIPRVLALADSELKKNYVIVHTELQPGAPGVLADRVQLEQVLLNLILNSNEARSAVDWAVRELVIRSQESKPDEVAITVRDSGTGLPPDSEEHICPHGASSYAISKQRSNLHRTSQTVNSRISGGSWSKSL